MLNPNFPVVSGRYQMTKEWSIELPGEFNRRFEEGDLVIWRPGLTIWIAVWGNENGQSARARLNEVKATMSPEAFDMDESEDSGVLRFSYRLNEESEDKRVPALYGFAFGETGQVEMGIYFDHEIDAKMAKQIAHAANEGAAL